MNQNHWHPTRNNDLKGEKLRRAVLTRASAGTETLTNNKPGSAIQIHGFFFSVDAIGSVDIQDSGGTLIGVPIQLAANEKVFSYMPGGIQGAVGDDISIVFAGTLTSAGGYVLWSYA